MVHSGYAISAYQSAQRTVPPLQAVVMLYDGVLARIAAAARAAREKDWEGQYNETVRAVTIINGLAHSLDLEAGGTVATNLYDMYETVGLALMRSVGKKDGADACDKIAAALRQTRDAWAEIAGQKPAAGASPASAPDYPGDDAVRAARMVGTV
ncbi:MAG: flagellar export chaperone FliS [Magnetospirillum sp.]|nr:flagellar export chaperone FliS [Magnetospirillum sp.]